MNRHQMYSSNQGRVDLISDPRPHNLLVWVVLQYLHPLHNCFVPVFYPHCIFRGRAVLCLLSDEIYWRKKYTRYQFLKSRREPTGRQNNQIVFWANREPAYSQLLRLIKTKTSMLHTDLHVSHIVILLTKFVSI